MCPMNLFQFLLAIKHQALHPQIQRLLQIPFGTLRVGIYASFRVAAVAAVAVVAAAATGAVAVAAVAVAVAVAAVATVVVAAAAATGAATIRFRHRLEGQSNLGQTGTIVSAFQGVAPSQNGRHHGVRMALDSEEGFDAGEHRSPRQQFALDDREVAKDEAIVQSVGDGFRELVGRCGGGGGGGIIGRCTGGGLLGLLDEGCDLMPSAFG
mmetsp:Transcript_33165/g.73180  ORF Transcript_33165/g.73180 Transcript_33165/m.73180 type:complete len:210 (-) Transcript_33165:215-844(-)